jgi:hypothetical protein
LFGGALIQRPLQRYVGDHFAAALPRWGLLQRVLATVKHADARGAVDLVAGEHEEVRAERLHIDGDMRDRLSAVDQHPCAVTVPQLDDLLGLRYGAGVRNMGCRNEFCLRAEQVLKLRHQQVPGIVHRGNSQLLCDTGSRVPHLLRKSKTVALHGSPRIEP